MFCCLSARPSSRYAAGTDMPSELLDHDSRPRTEKTIQSGELASYTDPRLAWRTAVS
jgi:hypothetical protein